MAHLPAVVAGTLLTLFLALAYATTVSSLADVGYLAPWILIVPLLEVLPGLTGKVDDCRASGHPACLSLAQLHRACGYSSTASKLIRGFIHVQCVLTGCALWRANAPGWVSMIALILLIGLFFAWFRRRRNSILVTFAGSPERARASERSLQC